MHYHNLVSILIFALGICNANNHVAIVDGDVQAFVGFKPLRNGSVSIFVKLIDGFKENVDYTYHVHVLPVVDGNCSATLAHFDPDVKYTAGTSNYTVKPISSDLPTYQTGDLSGKFGSIRGDSPEVEYSDNTISLDPTSKYSIVGRSVVFHHATSIVGCGSIVPDTDEPEQGSPAHKLAISYVSGGEHKAIGQSQIIQVPDTPENQQYPYCDFSEEYEQPTYGDQEEVKVNKTNDVVSPKPGNTTDQSKKVNATAETPKVMGTYSAAGHVFHSALTVIASLLLTMF